MLYNGFVGVVILEREFTLREVAEIFNVSVKEYKQMETEYSLPVPRNNFGARSYTIKDIKIICILTEIKLKDTKLPMWRKKKRGRKGFVYFIQADKFIKIGKTADLKKRMQDLGIQLPWPMKLIHHIVTDDMDGLERAFHEKYKEFRTNGEWFILAEKDINEIKADKVFEEQLEIYWA